MGQLIEALSSSGWAALALLFCSRPGGAGLPRPGPARGAGPAAGRGAGLPGPHPLAAALAVGGRRRPGRRHGRLLDRPPLGPRLLSSPLGRRVGLARLHKVEACCCGAAAGRWWWAAAPPGPGRAPRPGRHAGAALPVFVLWTGWPRPSGRRPPCPAWLPAAGAGWRHIHQLAGWVGIAARPGGGGRPGRDLAGAPPGPATPERARPVRPSGRRRD